MNAGAALGTAPPLVEPLDEWNIELLRRVHPSDWTNPSPAPLYDLVVIGAGTAGLVSAAGAAGLRARVALVERGLMGGDCLNVGCVPSKALLRSARLVGDARKGRALGVDIPDIRVDFAEVMQRMRRLRAGISPHDSAKRFADLGVDVFLGNARFTSPRTVAVHGSVLRFKRAVIATGARPAVPDVHGLSSVGYRTNETIFSLTELPRRLLVLGAGPIGCELAQAFARFGSEVTVWNTTSRILPREDADAAAIVERQMQADGVKFEHTSRVVGAERLPGGELVLSYERDGRMLRAAGDELLVATGRAAAVDALDLRAAGVAADARGVVVDDRLRTTNHRIYAAGDVASTYKFTHAADALARLVIQNALFHGRKKVSSLVIPWCTYTSPEVAHVGLYEQEARRRGLRVETITVPLSDVDRAVLDEETGGFVRAHHQKGRLLGCSIVAAHAGDLIAEAIYALTHGGTLAAFAGTIHPYPTQAEALKRCGDVYRRSQVTPALGRWLRRYFEWTRNW
jgi:pyruvate/2-oxoglutarate dehydrogenase complex dihydrolipoamide dehydrogenase (E3) component